MSTDDLYDQTLQHMGQTLHELAGRVPPPQRIVDGNSFVFRYVEKSSHQAIVQKLARYVSGLRAAQLLMNAGFVQEQASLQRILDELQEDVTFLSSSILFGATDLHKDYLEAFFQEEFDPSATLTSSLDRPTVSRKKIRAHIDRIRSGPKGSSKQLDAARTVSKVYSGYVPWRFAANHGHVWWESPAVSRSGHAGLGTAARTPR